MGDKRASLVFGTALVTRAPQKLRRNSSLDDADHLRLHDLEEPHHRSAGVDLPAGDSSTGRDYGSTAGQGLVIKITLQKFGGIVWHQKSSCCLLAGSFAWRTYVRRHVSRKEGSAARSLPSVRFGFEGDTAQHSAAPFRTAFRAAGIRPCRVHRCIHPEANFPRGRACVIQQATYEFRWTAGCVRLGGFVDETVVCLACVIL